MSHFYPSQKSRFIIDWYSIVEKMTHNQLVVLNEVIRVHNDVNQVNNGAPFEEHSFLADRLLYSAE